MKQNKLIDYWLVTIQAADHKFEDVKVQSVDCPDKASARNYAKSFGKVINIIPIFL